MALSDKPDRKPGTNGYRRRGCAVTRALADMPEVDADVLRSWLADPTWSYAEIARATAEDPDTPTLRQATIAEHVRGECCDRVRLRP